MTTYIYRPQAAVDSNGNLVTGTNLKGRVYAITDAALVSPLTVTDASGVAKTEISVSEVGQTEVFTVEDHPQLWWSAGSLPVHLVSWTSILDAAESAVLDARGAALAAGQSAAAARDAANLVDTPAADLVETMVTDLLPGVLDEALPPRFEEVQGRLDDFAADVNQVRNEQAAATAKVDGFGDALSTQGSSIENLSLSKRGVAATPLPAADHDLNDYIVPGSYAQTTSGQALLSRNYPQQTAGLLTVDGLPAQVFQTYRVLSTVRNVPGKVFERSLWAGGNFWSAWTEVVSTRNVVDIEPVATATRILNQANWTGILTTVDTGGRYVPKLVTKFIAGNHAGTGANMKPTRADILDVPPAAAGAGIPEIRSNSSGWRVTGSSGTDSSNLNEVIGLQIRNGVLLHDFDNIGVSALGFLSSGEAKIYRASQWTGAQVIADGVIESFCFGPALVENDVQQTVSGTERAGRTLLGQRSNGSIVLVHIFGVTGSSGATMPECAAYMKALGCANAVALDGGGSSQLALRGIRAQPSSDSTDMRPIPDILAINARLTQMPNTPWTALPLASGVTANEAIRLPQYRWYDGEIQLRGRVFGTFQGGGYATLGTLPPYFKTTRGGTCLGVGTGGVSGVVTIAPGSLSVQMMAQSTVGWFDLGNFRASQAQE